MSCLVVVALFCYGLYKLSACVERKASNVKYTSFYEQKESFDVLFMGTSHMINAVFPMELWKEYGIVSYNFGGHGNKVATSYWQLVNALDYVKPKLIVFDCFKIAEPDKVSSLKSQCHLSLDSIPLSINKARAVLDLFQNYSDLIEYIFKFSVYHHRWNEIAKGDICMSVNFEKGAETRIGVATPNPIVSAPKTEMQEEEEESDGIHYLKKVVDVCKAKKISLLLIYVPFPARRWRLQESHKMIAFAKEYGVKSLGWEELQKYVDFDTDCYDSDSHLNSSGARKITRFLGQYIRQHYNMPDHRIDSSYASWHKDYQQYTQFKIRMIKDQKSLKNALMLLSDRNFSYAVYFPNERCYQNKIIMKLLRNTGADVEKIYFSSPNLIVVDNKKEKVSYRRVNETTTTAFGKVSLNNSKDGRTLKVNGHKILEIKNNENLEAAVIVFENESGRLVVAAKYQEL